ncbi:MAG TPA: GIY-YIG nuclease family protein [Clostridia bacterium]|nr:GIY-YIG nuclease family protein [Clostridia bacterium]
MDKLNSTEDLNNKSSYCALCKNLSKPYKKVKENEYVCKKCYSEYYQPKKTCSVCGNFRTVQKVEGEKNICHSCYDKYYRPKQCCSVCGELSIIKKKNGTDSLCNSCYNKLYRPRRQCNVCNEFKKISMQVDDKDVCSSCYNKYFRPKAMCILCGATDFIAKNSDEGKICYSCYRKYFQPQKQCSICGNIAIIWKIIANNTLVCSHCYEKKYRPQKICSNCGKLSIVRKIVDDKYYCTKCYNLFFRPKMNCSLCGSYGHIVKKINENSVCQKCYRTYYAPTHICLICNEESRSAKRIGKDYICYKCYAKYYHVERVCSECGIVGRTALLIDGKSICPSCYNIKYRPKYICAICGNFTRISKIDGEKMICDACYHSYYRPKRVCTICGSKGIIRKQINGSDICQSCYDRLYLPKKICSICHKEGYAARTDNNESICHNCYRKLEGKCRECGNITKYFYHSEQLCSNCWYKKKSVEIVENTTVILKDNNYRNLLSEYLITLLKYRTSFSAYIIILNHIYIFLTLDNLGTEIHDITFDSIENLINEMSISHYSTLINFLTSKNIITPLIDSIKFQRYLNKLSKELINNSLSEVFIEYSNFLYVTHKRYKEHGYANKFTLKTCFNYCRNTSALIRYLEGHIMNISEVNNVLISEFLLQNKHCLCGINQFIIWLNHNIRLFKKLKDIKTPVDSSTSILELDYYTSLESLSLPSTPNKEKMICLLLLLYGVRPYEVINLKLSDYKRLNCEGSLYVRNVWITLHPFIANIVDEYLQFERNCKLALGGDNDWLLPGGIHNKPIDPASVSCILKKHNLNVKKGFSYAMKNYLLNANTQPSVIIQGLGLGISTVIQYYNALNISNSTIASDTCSNMLVESCSYSSNTQSSESPQKGTFTVYILRCNDGSYYTGSTKNIELRYKNHQKGVGCKYTSSRTPVELVYTELYTDRSTAIKREKSIKKLTVYEKEQLIIKSRI